MFLKHFLILVTTFVRITFYCSVHNSGIYYVNEILEGNPLRLHQRAISFEI